MLNRIIFIVILFASVLAPAASAQQEAFFDPSVITPEQMEAMMTLGQQMLQNAQALGLNDATLSAEFEREMANGTDPGELYQRLLVDRGLISPEQLNQVFGIMGNVAIATVRKQLASSDEEWAIVEIKLKRVVVAMADADPDGFGRLTGRLLGGMKAQSPMEKARRDLREAVANPNTAEQRFHIILDTWHREHAKAKAELATAREDLTRILTLRQEAILLNIGVL
jgi:hypothetical protein